MQARSTVDNRVHTGRRNTRIGSMRFANLPVALPTTMYSRICSKRIKYIYTLCFSVYMYMYKLATTIRAKSRERVDTTQQSTPASAT